MSRHDSRVESRPTVDLNLAVSTADVERKASDLRLERRS